MALLEGVSAICPSIKLVLNDFQGALSKELCLTDGNEILITVGKTPDDTKTLSRQYRYINRKKPEGSSGGQYTIYGVYDAPQYVLEAPRESYKGTSSQVLKAIADKCKLTYDGPEDFNGRQVVDSQVWLNVGKKRGAFVQKTIAASGYIDQHSGMFAALTSLGILKYRNLLDVIETPEEKIKYSFLHNIALSNQDSSKQVYAVQQSRDRSDSGLLNASLNYGSIHVSDGLSGVTSYQKKIEVKTSAKYLSINDQVSQTINQARVHYDPIDCGNVHENYYKAQYQNLKQLALFSERQSILVTEPTEVQLFDPVIYRQADADINTPVKNTDIYIVVGKTIFIARGSTYCERIELVRMSLTEKGETALKSAEPTSIRESAIPEVLVNPTVTIASGTLPQANFINSLIKSAESKFNIARISAFNTLNSMRQTLPSLGVFGMSINSLAVNPLQGLQTIRGTVSSLTATLSMIQEFKTDLQTAVTAIKDGNLQLIANNVPAVIRSASMFRQYGAVENLVSTFGSTSTIGELASLYKVAGEKMMEAKAAINLVTGAGAEIDAVVTKISSVQNEYQSILGSIAGGINTSIYAVTGEAPNLMAPRAEFNRIFLTELIGNSLNEPLSKVSAVQSVLDVKSSLIPLTQTRDETRNQLWIPESNFTTESITAGQFPDKLLSFRTKIDMAQKQLKSFNAGAKNG